NEWLVGPPKPTACSNVSNFTGVVSNDSLYMVVVGGYNGVGTTGANEWLNLGASPFVGVKELSSQLVVAVSPNPVSDILTVQIPSPLEMTTLAVFDLNERVVKEIQANSNKVQIVVRDLDNGVYILKMSDKKNSSTARFTVMH
ncbi:MAG: T9SS type A sorting domain-containing protein, partial [Bacteroidetes bacterium]|nr:T9SS type A sorting domain-containing protein [Bacteroidota bacterium]